MTMWLQTTLQEICLFIMSGGTPLRSINEYYEGGTIPWLKTGEVKKSLIYEAEESITEKGLQSSSAKLIPANSVIIAMYGDGNTAGHVAVNKIPLATNQACCNFTINPQKAYYQFVYYYLKGSYNNLISLKLGGSQQNLNAATLKRFSIQLPSLATQKKIAAILSAYDDLIENNKRRIALLEKMAEEIYREWFVRMRFPGHEKTKLEKGIPADWEVGNLGEIAHVLMGQSPKSEFYNGTGDGLPFNQGVGTYGFRSPNKRTFCTIEGRKAQAGDILFSVRAPVGRLNIADCEMIIGRGLAATRHKQELNSYLYYLLKVSFSSEDIIGNGAIFNSVGKDELNGFNILKPSNHLVESFNEKAKVIDAQISLLFAAQDKLIASRDLLLGRLISGKLSVEDLDIQFPPSMQEDVEIPEQEKAYA